MRWPSRNIDLALPSPCTIRSWYSGVDGEQGFTKQAFDALKAKASDNLSKYKETICSIMFDEMAMLACFNVQGVSINKIYMKKSSQAISLNVFNQALDNRQLTASNSLITCAF